MKTCLKCKRKLTLDMFYKNPNMPDGHLNHCKDCVRARVREYGKREDVKARDRIRKRNDPKHKYRMKKYHQDHKEQVNRIKYDWVHRNRLKRKAHYAVQAALVNGRIVRPDYCQDCGGQGELEAHHNDYTKPLEVIWLCSKCHGVRRHKVNAA